MSYFGGQNWPTFVWPNSTNRLVHCMDLLNPPIFQISFLKKMACPPPPLKMLPQGERFIDFLTKTFTNNVNTRFYDVQLSSPSEHTSKN